MPTTGDDLTEVMLEFAQRVQRERKLGSGVPPPFEITTNVVTLGPSHFPEPTRDETGDVIQQAPGIAVDNEFEFHQNTFGGDVIHHSVLFGILFRCHNPGKVGAESYIRVKGPPEQPQWINPATLTHEEMFIGFNQSTWIPPSVESGAFASVLITAFPQNVPPPHPPPQTVAIGTFALFVQRASDGLISDAVFGFENQLHWGWTSSANGIAVQFQFSY